MNDLVEIQRKPFEMDDALFLMAEKILLEIRVRYPRRFQSWMACDASVVLGTEIFDKCGQAGPSERGMDERLRLHVEEIIDRAHFAVDDVRGVQIIQFHVIKILRLRLRAAIRPESKKGGKAANRPL